MSCAPSGGVSPTAASAPCSVPQTQINMNQIYMGLLNTFPIIGPAIAGSTSKYIEEGNVKALSTQQKQIQCLKNQFTAETAYWQKQVTQALEEDADHINELLVLLAGPADGSKPGAIQSMCDSLLEPITESLIFVKISIFFLALTISALVFLL